MGIPAVSLFVSLTCCLGVFLQFAPPKKLRRMPCWNHIAIQMLQLLKLSPSLFIFYFSFFKQMSVSILLKRECPTQLLLFCQDFFP